MSLLAGFEAGYHNATSHTCTREETLSGLELFRSRFGSYPRTMAQHYNCDENLYWGDGRLSGWRRAAYNLLTRYQNHNKFFGHVEGHPCYWGDLCRDRIEYCRSFVFGEINTRKAWPLFPYHDPARPLVRFWYPSSEGSNKDRFCHTIAEANQELLEQEGGLCILLSLSWIAWPNARAGLLPSDRPWTLCAPTRNRSPWTTPSGPNWSGAGCRSGAGCTSATPRSRPGAHTAACHILCTRAGECAGRTNT